MLSILLAIQGCASTAPRNIEPPPFAETGATDAARFIAGLSVSSESSFFPIEQTAPWQDYSFDLARRWAKASKAYLKQVDAFQNRELAPLQIKSDFVFYPFSGPDVLFVTHFFPDARIYVLCGLEPVGRMPMPADFESNPDEAFSALEGATASLLARSFFITGNMRDDLKNHVANGAAPLICLLLARSGLTVGAVNYGVIDNDGKFVLAVGNSAENATGVEITFRGSPGSATQTLFYFSTDLGPPFAAKPGFSLFLRNLGTPETFVKSASFLMHGDNFSALRSQILATSNLVLQDDSGIPYHYFKEAGWRIELFGQYSGPDSYYKEKYQPDLAADFKDSAKVRPLNLVIGYGSYRRPSSLMLALPPEDRQTTAGN